MKYKVGQLVLNRKLGLGKVLSVNGDVVTAFFKDEAHNPRMINVSVVPMDIPKEQSDPAFSDEDDIERMKRPTKKAKRPVRIRLEKPVAKA